MVQPLPSSDAELVVLARDGREDAFAELYSRYFPRVYDFLARLLRDRQEAADVTQDTFIRAMQTLPNLEKPEAFRSWLFTIAHRNGLNLIKRSKRSIPTPTVEEPGRTNPLMRIVDEDRMSSPERVLEAREVAEVVWEAAAGLDTRTYTVLDLHVRQGLKSAEIADVMGVSKGNAYTMVNRMKSSIRDSLGVYLLARRGAKDCDSLAALLAPFYLPPVTPEIRRMVERHAKTCDTCTENREAYVLPLATFAALALVPPPAGTKAAILAALGGATAVTGSSQSSAASGKGTAATGAAAAAAAAIAFAATAGGAAAAASGAAGAAGAAGLAAVGAGGATAAASGAVAAGSAASAAGGSAAFGIGKVAAALAIVVAIGAGAIGAVSLLSGDQPPPDVAVLSSTLTPGNGDGATPENVPVATPGSTVAPGDTTTTTTLAPTTTTTPATNGGTGSGTNPPATNPPVTSSPATTPTAGATTSTTAAPTTTVPVTVTTAPPASPTAGADTVSTLEDVAVDVAVLANDDVSLDASTLAIGKDPAHGSLTLNAGSITYAPAKDFFGTDSFTYTAKNPAGLTATGTVTVSVSGVNDPPSVSGPVLLTVDEDTSISFDPMAPMFDVEGDAMSMVFFDPVTAAGGLVTEGSLIYTPPADFNGVDMFTYGISDGIDTTRVIVSVTVTSINDAPTGTAPSVSTSVDTPLLIDVLGAYTDVDGDQLSFVFINPFVTAAGGTFSLVDDQLLYVPPAGYSGADQLDYLITDGTDLVSGSVSIAVVVDGENAAPTVESQKASVSESFPVGAVVATMSASDLEGDAVTFSMVGDGPFAIDAATGDVVLTGLLDFESRTSYVLQVSATDSAGGVGEGTLTVDVLDVNEAPSISDAEFTITDTFKAGDTVGTLDASDPDAGDTMKYSVTGTDQFKVTADGFVVVAGDLDPKIATHEFVVTVTDSGGLTGSANVVVKVEAVDSIIGSVTVSPSAVYIVEGKSCDAGDTKLTVTVEIADPEFDVRNVTFTWLNRLERPASVRMQLNEKGAWTVVVQFGSSFVRDGGTAEMLIRAVSTTKQVAASDVFTVELLECPDDGEVPASAGRALQKAINLSREDRVSRRKRTL